MKPILTILGLLACASAANAQMNRDVLVNPAVRPSTAIPAKDTIPLPKKLPYNGMPNAIQYAPLPPVYRGNNGKGFDVYESRVDNMPVLMPDSTNRSGMPILKPAIRMMRPVVSATIPGNGKTVESPKP